jgi:hypothetical protein
LEKRRIVEAIYGGNNSIDLKNTNLDQRSIHIHGGMEHNLAGYAKYYFYGNIEISRRNEFTKEIDDNIRDFSRYW